MVWMFARLGAFISWHSRTLQHVTRCSWQLMRLPDRNQTLVMQRDISKDRYCQGLRGPSWAAYVRNLRILPIFCFVLFYTLNGNYLTIALVFWDIKMIFNHANENQKRSPLAVWDSAAFGYYPLKKPERDQKQSKGGAWTPRTCENSQASTQCE
jgi:hypothetical protein